MNQSKLVTKKKQDEPNFKVIKKKVVRKKVIKKAPVPKTEEAKNILTKLKKKEVKPKKIVKSSKPRRKIVKKIVKAEANTIKVEEIPVVEDNTLTEEIDMLEVQCISYQEKEYFLDLKTEKVYKLNEDDLLVFVGMLEGKQVNFDAESAED